MAILDNLGGMSGQLSQTLQMMFYSLSWIIYLIFFLVLIFVLIWLYNWGYRQGHIIKNFPSKSIVIDRTKANLMFKSGRRTVIKEDNLGRDYETQLKAFPLVTADPCPSELEWVDKDSKKVVFMERMAHDIARYVEIKKHNDGEFYLFPQPIREAVIPAMRKHDKKYLKKKASKPWYKNPFLLAPAIIGGMLIIFIFIIMSGPAADGQLRLVQDALNKIQQFRSLIK